MLLPLVLSLLLLTGNTVLHVDKTLPRMREYDCMKLQSEFNPRSASPIGVCDLSNAAHPSAYSAEKTEGRIIHEIACRQLPPQPGNGSFFLRFVNIYCDRRRVS